MYMIECMFYRRLGYQAMYMGGRSDYAIKAPPKLKFVGIPVPTARQVARRARWSLAPGGSARWSFRQVALCTPGGLASQAGQVARWGQKARWVTGQVDARWCSRQVRQVALPPGGNIFSYICC